MLPRSEVKTLKSKFTQLASDVLDGSAREARSLGHSYIGTEHLLLSLLKKSSSAAAGILLSHGITYESTLAIAKEISGAVSDIRIDARDMTPRMRRIIEASASHGEKYGQAYIGTEHLLLAMLDERESVAVKLMISQGASVGEIQNDISVFLGDISGTRTREKQRPHTPPAAVLQFGHDITESARRGMLDPVIGRDAETERVIQILSRRSKNNPCLIGEPGVGKTAVVEGLSLRIANGAVPGILAGKSVISIDIGAMIAGAKYRGEFEDRIKKIMNEVASSKNVILFIDELHTIVGAGAAEGAVDAANILKPALARGEIQIIGATTSEEYRRHIEKDAALERRFQPVTVEEPTHDGAIRIIEGIREKYELHHGVKISDGAIRAAVTLSERYITDRFLPDKAIDLIDEASSAKRIKVDTVPENVRQLSEKARALCSEKEKAICEKKFSLAAKYREEAAEAENEYDRAFSEWQDKKEKRSLCVTAADVERIVTMWTGIPVSELEESEKEKLINLEERLKSRIIGQDAAVSALCRAVRKGRLGLSDPSRPVGSFIFAGPTGVGKTELATELAEALFGSREAIIRLDMSEYMESHSVSKLIGSPPGYVGFDEGGGLTERIRRAPYSVVLFDEIEKAHRDIFNLFLQILEDGSLTDSRGVKANFRNAVIIMTSNIGSSSLSRTSSLGFGTESAKERDENNRKLASDALKEYFRPEFLGRVDEIIFFDHLDEESVRRISEKMLGSIKERIAKLGVDISFDESVIELVAKRGFDKRSGAREARREIGRLIEDSFAEEFMRGKLTAGDIAVCFAKGGKILYEKNSPPIY